MNSHAAYTAAGVALLALAVFALFSWGAPLGHISAAAGLLLIVVGQSMPRHRRGRRRRNP